MKIMRLYEYDVRHREKAGLLMRVEEWKSDGQVDGGDEIRKLGARTLETLEVSTSVRHAAVKCILKNRSLTIGSYEPCDKKHGTR